MRLIPGADFFVRYMKMPDGFYGFVTPNDDCTYYIYIDPTSHDEIQRATYQHEVGHLINDDFSIGTDPVEAEKRFA